MLCQFTVKNFKSIRDEVTFDMQAAAISEHEDMDRWTNNFRFLYGRNGRSWRRSVKDPSVRSIRQNVQSRARPFILRSKLLRFPRMPEN